MKIDLTPILQAIISLIAIIITYRLVPWLKSKLDNQDMENLKTAARVVVFAAEQLFDTGVIVDKLNYAMARLEEQGWDLDKETLRDVIESAVKELKVESKDVPKAEA